MSIFSGTPLPNDHQVNLTKIICPEKDNVFTIININNTIVMYVFFFFKENGKVKAVKEIRDGAFVMTKRDSGTTKESLAGCGDLITINQMLGF